MTMEKIKRSLSIAGLKIRKHSPEILTVGGIIGFGVTVALIYKATPKVEKIVEKIEETREAHLEVNKIEVAKDLGKALALPIITGTLSVGAVVWSYNIQRNRIFVLSGALTASQAMYTAFENKYKEQYGEEEYQRFVSTEQQVITRQDENGEDVDTVEDTKKDLIDTEGMWYDQSEFYVSDDHGYNLEWIRQMGEDLDVKFFAKGYLSLNEVYAKLGFPKTRIGALLGWSTTGDFFDLRTRIFDLVDPETKEFKKQILVTWSTPKYIYGDMDFEA